MIGWLLRRFKRKIIWFLLNLSALVASGFIIFNSYEGAGVWDVMGFYPGLWCFVTILISMLRR